MPRFLTNLAGLQFRPLECKERVKQLKAGDQVLLLRDPMNEWDENAIQVMAPTDDPAAPMFIGFVEKLTNGPIARDLDDGYIYTATVSNVYDDYENSAGKSQWAKPLIEIITELPKNSVLGEITESPFDPDAAERELAEAAEEGDEEIAEEDDEPSDGE